MSTLTFEAALSVVLAHTLVYESRRGVDEALGHRDWFLVAGGDPPPSTKGESTNDMMAAWSNWLPTLLKQQSDTTNQLAPGQNQAALDLSKQFMPQFTDQGIAQDKQQRLGQAANDLAVLNGPGKELTSAALAAQEQADPEFYKERAQSSDALTKLFGSLDTPTGQLSGGEQAAIERSNAQDNNRNGVVNPTATSTITNAMNFGNAAAAKKQQQQGAISAAVNTATGQMPASKSGIDTFQLTTGRSSMPNQGLSQFAGTKDLAGANAQASSGLMGNIQSNMANAQNINANRRDSLDRMSQVLGSMPSVSCCWIWRERYGSGAAIPWYVRASRDLHYTPRRRSGYQRMSRAIIPAMRRSRVARFALDFVMFWPLASHAKWLFTGRGLGWLMHPVATFYLTLWSLLGSNDTASVEAYG